MRMPMPMPRKTTKTEAKTTPSFVALVVFVGLMFLSLSLSWAPAPAAAQTVQAASPETGATALPGPTPRLPNGKPDLSGIWQKPYVPDVTKAWPNHQAIADLPFTPWGLENWTNYDPIEGDYTGNCMPFGLSRSINGPFPMRIMQDETHIALLFELGTWFHVIRSMGVIIPRNSTRPGLDTQLAGGRAIRSLSIRSGSTDIRKSTPLVTPIAMPCT